MLHQQAVKALARPGRRLNSRAAVHVPTKTADKAFNLRSASIAVGLAFLRCGGASRLMSLIAE
jgi:hypothetical protein